MISRKNRKRIRMIVIWVLFLAVGSVLIFHVENTIHFKNAQKDLLEQAQTVSGQIPAIVENDLCTQVAWEMLFAKLQALSFALEPYDDIEEAAADLSGMQTILTYAKTYPEFDYDKFFAQASRVFTSTGPAGTSYVYVIVDNHPLTYLRVNIDAQMFDTMYDHYGVQEGDGMYLAPEERIRFWGAE